MRRVPGRRAFASWLPSRNVRAMSQRASGIEVDATYWPLVIVVVSEILDAGSVADLIRRVDVLHQRREHFATLVDTTAVKTLPRASERQALAEWQNRTIEVIRRYNVVTATVIENSLVRGVMTAMNWVFRPPNEQVSVASFREGLSICCDRLRAAGIPLGDALAAAEARTPSSYRAMKTASMFPPAL